MRYLASARRLYERLDDYTMVRLGRHKITIEIESDDEGACRRKHEVGTDVEWSQQVSNDVYTLTCGKHKLMLVEHQTCPCDYCDCGGTHDAEGTTWYELDDCWMEIGDTDDVIRFIASWIELDLDEAFWVSVERR